MARFDYKEMVKRSFRLSLQQKWLWIYGLIIVMYGGGATSSNFRAQDFAEKIKQPVASPSVQKLISPPPNTLPSLEMNNSLLLNWFSQIPLVSWVLFVLAVAGFVGLQIVIAWVLHLWAKGALIAGIDTARSTKLVTLTQTSPTGLGKLKHLFIFSLITFGLTLGLLGIFAISGILIFLLAQFNQTAGIILGGITAGVAVATCVVFGVIVAMVSIYAERLIVLKKVAPWPAWKKALKIAKNNFLPTVVTSIVNQAVGCSLGCITSIGLLAVFGIPFVALLLPLIKGGLKLPTIPQLLGLVGVIILFAYTNLLINAILTVFRFSMWSDLFIQIEKGESHGT